MSPQEPRCSSVSVVLVEGPRVEGRYVKKRLTAMISVIVLALVTLGAAPAYGATNRVTLNPGASGGICFIVAHAAGVGAGRIDIAAGANGLFTVEHDTPCP